MEAMTASSSEYEVNMSTRASGRSERICRHAPMPLPYPAVCPDEPGQQLPPGYRPLQSPRSGERFETESPGQYELSDGCPPGAAVYMVWTSGRLPLSYSHLH